MADDEHEEFSLATAGRAADEGRLGEWVTAFLASPGSDNAPLAARLALEDTAYHGPIRFRLDRLTPMAGPDPDQVVVPVEEDVWERDVEAMADSVEHGWEPPPLLVSHHDGRFLLEDGNHRCESLRRSGATHAWTILLFRNERERAEFLEHPRSQPRAHPAEPPTPGPGAH